MKRNKCARKKYKMYSDRKATVKLEVANNICTKRDKVVRIIRRGLMFYS